MSSKRPTLVVSTLVALGLLSLACGLGEKLEEKAAEEVFERALEEAGGDGSVELDVGQEIDISDLPVWLSYPNAKATGKMTLAQEGEEGTMYVLETADELATVTDWYKGAMKTWEQSASFETPESMQLVYSDGAGQAVQLTLARENETTIISCWYAKTEPPEVAEDPEAKPFQPRAPGGKRVGPGSKGCKGKKPAR